MEALLSRFRNLTVLVVAVVAQLLYLAYQVKTNGDERLIRIWAVTAVTPLAGIVEAVRHNTIGFLEDYFILLDVREQNRKLKAANDRLQMENIYFRNQLSTAEHARALVQFQTQNPSKTIAARVIGNSTVASAKAVFIDRGSTSGVGNGMAVVTPEGIVGKVAGVYPLVAQVLLVTDATFKVGVESQKGHVHGVLNCGSGKCVVEQVQNEDKVDAGEWFYTSGEDRIFPKGFPVGKVVSSQPGQGMRDVKLNLSASPGAAEEVLVVVHGIHQQIPTTPPPPAAEELDVHMLPPAPKETGREAAADARPQTEADKILARYDTIGKEQGHVYGGVGSSVPNFNVKKQPDQAAKSETGTKTEKPATATTDAAARNATAPNTPAKAAASTPSPSVLGARPPAKKEPQPTFKLPESETAPPLGTPRRKPATATTTGAPPQP
jgi:rod shape-determining protein MreC